MSAAGFAYRDLAVDVESDPAPLAWLRDFLTPAFEVRDGGAPDVRVAMQVDAGEYQRLLAGGPRPDRAAADCFALDSGMTRLPWWTAEGDERVLHDADGHVFYGLSPDASRVRVVVDEQRPSRRVGLLRAVRELASTRAWSPTSAVLHAAALAVGERGIVIAGPKGAGKTTLLLQLLLACDGASFVSNDRVVVDVADAAVTLQGMPTIMKVLRPPAEHLPGLRARLADVRGDFRLSRDELAHEPRKVVSEEALLQCTPAQLCTQLELPMLARMHAAVLLFPRVGAPTEQLGVRELPARAAAARLRTLFLGGATPVRSQVFEVAAKPGCIAPGALAALCRRLAGACRSFDCILGADSDRPAGMRDLLDEVLGRSGPPRGAEA